MSARASMVVWGLAALCVAFASGCGVIVQLTTSPAIVTPGTPVNFGIKLTNPSQCPVGDVVGTLAPFVPAEDIVVEGEPEIVELVELLILAACTGSGFELPDGIICEPDGTTIVCEMTDSLSAPGTGGEVTVRSGADVVFTCSRQGSRITCEAPPPEGTAALTLAQQTLTCVPGMDGEQECTLALLPGGQMATANLVLPAPAQPGVFFNILQGQAGRRGVCKNTGAPCSSDSQCPGGAMDVCASGVCADDMTQAPGVGCDNDGDCLSTSHCVPCTPQDTLTFPFACTQTVVRLQASTPAMSWWSFAAAALAVVLVQMLGRRHWRRA